MPYALQLYQVFRSRWCGAYMQAKGLTVIPTLYWGKPQSYWFAFEGIEEGCITAVSTVGVRKEKDFFLQGYNEMLRRIKPKAILCYGQPFPEMEGNVIVIDYARTNNLTGHKKYWTICSDDTDEQRCIIPFAVPLASGIGLSIHKAGGTILLGYGSGGPTPMGRHNRNTPRDHRRQNRQTSDIAKALKLTKAQQRELHDLISGQGLSYQEILEIAQQWFQK